MVKLKSCGHPRAKLKYVLWLGGLIARKNPFLKQHLDCPRGYSHELGFAFGKDIGKEGHGHSPLHAHWISAFGLEQMICFKTQLFG